MSLDGDGLRRILASGGWLRVSVLKVTRQRKGVMGRREIGKKSEAREASIGAS